MDSVGYLITICGRDYRFVLADVDESQFRVHKSGQYWISKVGFTLAVVLMMLTYFSLVFLVLGTLTLLSALLFSFVLFRNRTILVLDDETGFEYETDLHSFLSREKERRATIIDDENRLRELVLCEDERITSGLDDSNCWWECVEHTDDRCEFRIGWDADAVSSIPLPFMTVALHYGWVFGDAFGLGELKPVSPHEWSLVFTTNNSLLSPKLSPAIRRQGGSDVPSRRE